MQLIRQVCRQLHREGCLPHLAEQAEVQLGQPIDKEGLISLLQILGFHQTGVGLEEGPHEAALDDK